MSSKHTLGPWWVRHKDHGRRVEFWIACDGGSLPLEGFRNATMGASVAEAEANARLIAAAPDLLAACEAALPWVITATVGNPELNPQTVRNQADVIARLQAAIARTEGGEA